MQDPPGQRRTVPPAQDRRPGRRRRRAAAGADGRGRRTCGCCCRASRRSWPASSDCVRGGRVRRAVGRARAPAARAHRDRRRAGPAGLRDRCAVRCTTGPATPTKTPAASPTATTTGASRCWAGPPRSSRKGWTRLAARGRARARLACRAGAGLPGLRAAQRRARAWAACSRCTTWPTRACSRPGTSPSSACRRPPSAWTGSNTTASCRS